MVKKNTQLVKAYNALTELMKLKLPYLKCRAMLQLKNIIKPDCELYAIEENKLIQEFVNSGKVKKGRQTLDFNVSDDNEKNRLAMIEYLERIEQIKNIEISIDFPTIHISDSEMENQAISAETIENLEGIIEFGGD